MKISKPWGNEEILEQNENYVLKRLFMKKEHCCSLQYHVNKHETIYVLSGTLLVTLNENTMELKEGSFIVIPPKIVHRMEGITDCIYLETSTNHLDDVIRLEDRYGGMPK